MRKTLGALGVVVGFLALSVPWASAQVSRNLSVTPNTGLVDFQAVTVAGSGYTQNATLGVCQSVPGIPPGTESCGNGTLIVLTTSGTGDFTSSFTVHRFMRVPVLHRTVDCLSEQCTIASAEAADIPGTLVTVPISFAEPPPPPSRLGRISASPNTDLVPNQVVTVNGSRFSPNVNVVVLQCVPGADDPTDCVGFTTVVTTTDGSGAFQVPFTLVGSVSTGGAPVNCMSGPGACVIAAAEVANVPETIVSAPLTFRPSTFTGTITVTPTTGLVDGQTVTVAGSGFTPSADVAATQCGPDVCNSITFFTASPAGDFTQTLAVSESFGGLLSVDCAAAPGTCFIAVLEFNNPDAFQLIAPLTFGFPTPATKDDCKNGGWRNFFDDAGQPFNNQGQCAAFLASARPAA